MCDSFAAMIRQLNESILREASAWLAERDEALARVLALYGHPPLWRREPSFSTLVHIILEQQVSLASANAVFKRLCELANPLTPEALLRLPNEALRTAGLTRQKTAYVQGLAQCILRGELNLTVLEDLSDDEVRQALKRVKGIGDWTADIYLSECLLRPDILPKGDIAMQEAFRAINKLPKRPCHAEFEQLTNHWRPWRSVGTRILWHFYLCERGRKFLSEE
ncbi:MAG: hypothetical protein NZM43_13345 [Saprospiraceae bacterium]|nr:hypothetical protein [Saprospiraceae bacterium]MDW8485300.1 hypothetical protein [Saprospiraceae bacterium]